MFERWKAYALVEPTENIQKLPDSKQAKIDRTKCSPLCFTFK